MLRTNHKAIAQKIAAELKFSTENTSIFVSGSIGPDSHADFPHATGKDRKILSKIETARTLYLMNDEYSYGELGNALHYIQDKWVNNPPNEQEAIFASDDDDFLKSVKQMKTPDETAKEYLSIANTLLTTKNTGIESWFNHSWGIWHRDYASCIYVFADIVELMLPTLQPDTSITGNEKNLRTYVRSEAFRKATQEGFYASVITNFLYPKTSGYSAAIYCLASISPPSGNGNPAVDLNISYRLSLEIARYTLSPPEWFKFRDNWTDRITDQNSKRNQLTYIVPQYHVLITEDSEKVHEERHLRFNDERKNFLIEWPKIQATLQTVRQRSETWKILLSQLVEFLQT